MILQAHDELTQHPQRNVLAPPHLRETRRVFRERQRKRDTLADRMLDVQHDQRLRAALVFVSLEKAARS